MPRRDLYFIPENVIAWWADTLRSALGDLNGRVYVSDLHRVFAPRRVAATSITRAMHRLGWDGPIRVDSIDRTRQAYLKGTPEERRLVIYLYRDPVTRQLTVGHAKPGAGRIP